jgi:hypothetical protein
VTCDFIAKGAASARGGTSGGGALSLLMQQHDFGDDAP